MTAMSPDLIAECEAIWDATEVRERASRLLRQQPADIRLYDGEGTCHAWVTGEESHSFEWVDNDTGTGEIVLDFEHYAAQWMYDEHSRMERGEKRTVLIRADKDGARWTGMLDDLSVEERDDGTQVVVVRFLSDYEQTKWYTIWSAPFLPAGVQAPRVFLLAGGARWVCKTAFLFQLLREHNPLITFPDDPMDYDSWLDGLDMSTWSVVVKPSSFMDDLEDGITWAVLPSRFKNWHDVCAPILEDAELSVVWRRWFPGDPEPWPGADLRPGTLVLDIVDKSGFYTGTANGGTLWDGFVRTVHDFAEGFIDTIASPLVDVPIPDYEIPGFKRTDPRRPFVHYWGGPESGLVKPVFRRKPAKGTVVTTGGHSMPGVNEAISAGVQATFDALGNLAQIGSIGGSVDTLLKPFYEDTIAAWMSVKSLTRASETGWIKYFEFFQDGADKAYTLTAFMVLRTGFRVTDEELVVEVNVLDGSPWLIGDQGQGHFFIGDRGSFSLANDKTGTIHVQRCRSLVLKADQNSGSGWTPTFGDKRGLKDAGQRAMEKLESVVAAVHDLGVF